MEKCPKCHGYKELTGMKGTSNRWITCPVCKGEGKVPDDYKPHCKQE